MWRQLLQKKYNEAETLLYKRKRGGYVRSCWEMPVQHLSPIAKSEAAQEQELEELEREAAGVELSGSDAELEALIKAEDAQFEAKWAAKMAARGAVAAAKAVRSSILNCCLYPNDYSGMRWRRLKELLRQHGLRVRGRKEELVARLVESDNTG